MRLIDADALREHHCDGCSEDVKASCKDDPVCATLMWVDEAPTIDAVPVVHGRWDKNHKKKWYCDDNLDSWYATPEICTNCGYDATEHGKGVGNYCPNCGANMDLVVDGE